MANINGFIMDGLGNNFIIIDKSSNSLELTKDKVANVVKSKNIEYDQIIFIEKKKNNSFPITIFNSDGGEVSACGNGSRCIAYLLGKKYNSKKIQIITNNRLLDAEIVGDFLVKLNMGKPFFKWKQIPLNEELDAQKIKINIDGKIFNDGFCLNIGNPHVIFFVENCFEYDLKLIGPKIECHAIFPERTNVTFAQIENKQLIKVNVWERGAGLTKACGTAACATAVAAFQKKMVDNNVDIKFEEGLLNIEIDDNNNIFMTGPVSRIKNINLKI